jgi:hypothetical protein
VSIAAKKYFPLFFLALTSGHLDSFEHGVRITDSTGEREKGISRSPVQGNSKVEASEVKSEVIRVSRHLAVLTI